MNRLIEFRAKVKIEPGSDKNLEYWNKIGIPTTKDGWVFGCPTKCQEKVFMVGDIAETNEDCCTMDWWVIINPDTIGMYSGMRDEFGRKIFEGDILQVWRKGTTFPPYVIVYYCPGEAAFKVRYSQETAGYPLGLSKQDYQSVKNTRSMGDYFRVVGNIYDDQQLLEEEEKNNNGKT